MKNAMAWSSLTFTFLVVACGGAAADPFTTGAGASAGSELVMMAGSAGAPSGAGGSTSMGGSLGVSRGGSAGAGSNAGSIGVGGSAGAASSGGTGSAGAPSMAGAGGAAAGSSGTGGGGANAGGMNAGGTGGVVATGPKRVTVVGVFGGQNAQGPEDTATPGSMYSWPDGRILEWTEYEDGAPLGPTSSGMGDVQGAGPVTAGAELEIGSDARVSMPDAGTVAIVKFCRANTLIADWTQPESAIPWLADYESILDQAGAAVHTKYPSAQVKFVHVFINGEYDAQKGVNVDPAALATTIRALNTKLTTKFPGSIIVATEPNFALTSWWPENAHVRAAYEAISDASFYLVNDDAIPPWNASAHDPSFNAPQELNLGSRIEYGIEHQIEKLWGAP